MWLSSDKNITEYALHVPMHPKFLLSSMLQ